MSATAVHNDLSELAPRFRAAVQAAIADCRGAGYDVVVFEALRTQERQAWLYAQGRTRPGDVVTNASDAQHGWHFFGLAVDVISASKEWAVPKSWWSEVGTIFERHGCDWGGRWKMHDTPHMQWGALKPSPSDRARELYAAGGLEAVWSEVGALDAPSRTLLAEIPAPVPNIVRPPIVAPTPPPLRTTPVVLPPRAAFIPEDNMDKSAALEFLKKELTEERTDRGIQFVGEELKRVLPDIPVEIAERVADWLLPNKIIAVLEHALS